jgi:hypothetical protein
MTVRTGKMAVRDEGIYQVIVFCLYRSHNNRGKRREGTIVVVVQATIHSRSA